MGKDNHQPSSTFLSYWRCIPPVFDSSTPSRTDAMACNFLRQCTCHTFCQRRFGSNPYQAGHCGNCYACSTPQLRRSHSRYAHRVHNRLHLRTQGNQQIQNIIRSNNATHHIIVTVVDQSKYHTLKIPQLQIQYIFIISSVVGWLCYLYYFSLQNRMQSDNLRYYYQHLYPYNALYTWLTYNDKIPLEHRELSFEYANESVQRYVKFRSPQQFKARMTSIDEEAPRKVDAGAVWSGPPSKDNKQFRPVQRQFIFDFDMNDYDDVRTCCTGKKTCVDCWKFMLVAKDVLTRALSEDFGFNKFMFVFSGGRGMHIWVCDEEARVMPDSMRKAIVDYLEVVTGNSKGSTLLADNTFPNSLKVFNKQDPKNKFVIKSEMYSNLHPHLMRSLEIIKQWFAIIFNQQQPFTHEKAREVVFKILESRSKKLKERVMERWAKCDQSVEKMWSELCEEVDHYEMTASDQEYPLRSYQIENRKYQRITFIEQQIMFSFLYPRMDYNVSTMQNHLLKLPFSIHPSTQNVSVPLFSSQVQKFNPKQCITLGKLIEQLQQLHKQGVISYKDTAENAHKTLLSQYLLAMEDFCHDL